DDFLFASRRRHTRFSRDWSSDVCSSDLRQPRRRPLSVAKPYSPDRQTTTLNPSRITTMKSKNLFITIGTLATLALLAGCAQGTSSPAATAAQSPTGPEPAPLTSITISGNDQMKFDITNFTVAAGTEITLTFKNVGTMPKESMGHNLVVL